MVISTTEYKSNLELVDGEDVIITKNEKTVVKIINSNFLAVDSLKGMLKDTDLNKRLAKK